MDFSGLVGKFPLNRPLSSEDYTYQLKQTTRLDMEPHDMLAVIKMNSTFLESVDKWFGFRGFTTAFSLTAFLIVTVPFGLVAGESLLQALGWIDTDQDRGELAVFGAGFAIVLGLIWWAMFAIFKKESFAYTHYPIRFNRQNRMVYYFRVDGEVASVSWDDVFFTIGQGSNLWSVRGHVLADDKVTVLDTFSLSHIGMIYSHEPDPDTGKFHPEDYVRPHWEFIRRYMEEGPQDLVQRVRFCLPISDRKETLKAGFWRLLLNSGEMGVTTILMSPLYLWMLIGRRIAVMTSKIPQWPAKIDAVCRVEPGDPFAITGDNRGDCIPDTAHG